MKFFCVISHTHWDREWYQPLEVFRLRLVDLIDRCLETLRKYPDFVFHLDAQTIVLEDYLAIRPSKYKLLKDYISQGRLVVGPWYLQNDFYLTSGEATVRNLLEGHKIATEFGDCCKVGYAPDQFGNISQLPQILNDFGIDNFIFGRGISEYKKNEQGQAEKIPTPSEFIWCGADGSKVLAVHMTYWYNNAQRFSADTQKAKLLVDVVDKMFEGVAMTPYILLMNGVDHLEGQDDLLPILDKVNACMDSGKKIAQYRMDKYIDDIKQYINDNDIELNTYHGELRKGNDLEILKGTLSSRSYLKIENVKAQNMLECRLEPIYSILEMSGAKGAYSLDHFRYMWKELLKNHPHDSICGCSRDEVHMHMEDNFKRLKDTADEMLKRGLLIIAEHLGLNGCTEDDYALIAVNTIEKNRNGVMEAILDFPVAENIVGFDIIDETGEKVQYDILSKEKSIMDIFSPINLPGSFEMDRYRIILYAENVNGMAVKGYKISKTEQVKEAIPLNTFQLNGEGVYLENEYLKVAVSENGNVDIFNKETKTEIIDAIDFEETGDRGDSYIYNETGCPAIFASSFKASIEVLRYNDYINECRITRRIRVPADYDFKEIKRTDELVECVISLTLTLEKGSKTLKTQYEIDNKAKHHRIRMLINTGIQSEYSTSDIPFDIVAHTEEEHCFDTMSKVFPNTSFALIEDGDRGVAVFTEGTHEYEHIKEKNTLAFTLVRGTGAIARWGGLTVCGGEQWYAPENQCIRKMSGRLGIMPYEKDYISAQIPIYSKEFRNPIIPFFAPCDRKKFAGGRTAVQDTKLEEIFYLPDPYLDVKIPNNKPLIEIKGDGVVLTALKKSEDGTGVIARLINLSNKSVNAEICMMGEIYISDMSEERHEYLAKDNIKLSLNAKKILTLKVIR